MPTNPIQLEDGLLRFTILNRETGEATKHSLDVLLLRLTCQECEALHNLQADANGSYVVTSAYLADLTNRIAGMGVPECTASIAYQLWGASIRGIDDLQKKTSETPSLPSGSESSPGQNPDESAVSNSPPPAESPSINGSAY
jgi:hypothetical protein